jgi:hypothetical protein
MDEYLKNACARLDACYEASLKEEIYACSESCKAVVARAKPLSNHQFQRALESHGTLIAKVLDRPSKPSFVHDYAFSIFILSDTSPLFSVYGWTEEWRGVSSLYEAEEKAKSGVANGSVAHDFEYAEPPIEVRGRLLDDPAMYKGLGLEDAISRVQELTSDAQATATKIGYYEINGGRGVVEEGGGGAVEEDEEEEEDSDEGGTDLSKSFT